MGQVRTTTVTMGHPQGFEVAEEAEVTVDTTKGATAVASMVVTTAVSLEVASMVAPTTTTRVVARTRFIKKIRHL